MKIAFQGYFYMEFMKWLNMAIQQDCIIKKL